jgi:hypothetical protein
MTVPFHLDQRCDACERESDPGCQMLRARVLAAVVDANEAAMRNRLKLPPGAEVTLSCPAFWRRGKGHGA